VLAPEQQLRWRLREISKEWPRYGFRRAWALLRQEGWKVNRKRVQRVWREEGLRVPAYAPKRRRVGESTVPAQRLRAERPNHVWALDFLFDATSDGHGVSQACRDFRMHRSTYYRWRRQVLRHGLEILRPRERRLPCMPTDNGQEFRSFDFRNAVANLGAEHRFIRAGRPQTNCVAERRPTQDSGGVLEANLRALPGAAIHRRQTGSGRRLLQLPTCPYLTTAERRQRRRRS